MIERVHEHIIDELRTNTRTDTIFVLTAIALNLLTLGINSGVAAAAGRHAGVAGGVFYLALAVGDQRLVALQHHDHTTMGRQIHRC